MAAEAVDLFLHGVRNCAHDCRYDGACGAASEELAGDGGNVETARERRDQRLALPVPPENHIRDDEVPTEQA